MKNLYAHTVRQDGKTGLRIIGAVLLALAVVLFLQSRVFNSSLWVLLIFSYETWQDYLWQILRILALWAGVTGVIFAIEFGVLPINTDLKRLLTSAVMGFVTGYLFTYLLVLMLGILIFILLGLLSLFIQDIVEYATLEFAGIAAGYIVFLWIAVGTPALLLDAMRQRRWSLKLLAAALMLELGIHLLKVVVSASRIILESTRWITRMDAGLLTVFGSLAVTLIVTRVMLGRRPLGSMVFAVVGVYVASVLTGNLSQIIFRWGEVPTAVLAALVGPVLYSWAVRSILQKGFAPVFGLLGTFAGLLAGLFIAQYTGLSIIGRGWSGILCGTLIAIGFGIAFGGIWGQALIQTLVSRTRLRPEIALSMGIGLFLGIILGMVLGGFIGR